MVALLRQFLVVLLVLLQCAAPLVHAHTGGNAYQSGLHIHEFESFSHVANEVALVAASQDSHADSVIVDIDSAIKHQSTDNDSITAFYLHSQISSFAISRQADTINFSTQPLAFVPSFFISHNTSRAPPL
jgi:hypothetical protein